MANCSTCRCIRDERRTRRWRPRLTICPKAACTWPTRAFSTRSAGASLARKNTGPAGTLVLWQGAWQLVTAVLACVRSSVFDEAVGLVQKTNLPCRLVALRCSEEVANRRRHKLRVYTRKKKGRDPSPEQLRMCAW